MADTSKLFSFNSKERGLSQEDSSIVAYRQHEVYSNVYILQSAIANIDPELVREEEAPKVVTTPPVEKSIPNQVSGNVISFAAAQEREQEAEVQERIDVARRLTDEARSA